MEALDDPFPFSYQPPSFPPCRRGRERWPPVLGRIAGALGVRADTTALESGASRKTADPAADEFASAMTTSFPDLCRRFSDLDRLQGLYEMVALARGMQLIPEAVSDYWLKTYAVSRTPTPRTGLNKVFR